MEQQTAPDTLDLKTLKTDTCDLDGLVKMDRCGLGGLAVADGLVMVGSWYGDSLEELAGVEVETWKDVTSY